jgi:hypothetical protein
VTVNLPAFHQQSTTNSPSKNHVLHPVFAKTPAKTGKPARKKLLQKRSLFDPQAVTPNDDTCPMLRPAAAWKASYREALGIR